MASHGLNPALPMIVIGGPYGALVTESSGSFCFDEQECERYE